MLIRKTRYIRCRCSTCVSFTKEFRKGMMAKPNTRTIPAMTRYAFLYNLMSAIILSLSFSATGLYRLYMILDPIPASASESMARIFVNNPFTPK
ncbi:hypothetical protein D3C86_1570040 [compost metagenome]